VLTEKMESTRRRIAKGEALVLRVLLTGGVQQARDKGEEAVAYMLGDCCVGMSSGQSGLSSRPAWVVTPAGPSASEGQSGLGEC
jgi:hypothetical protein